MERNNRCVSVRQTSCLDCRTLRTLLTWDMSPHGGEDVDVLLSCDSLWTVFVFRAKNENTVFLRRST
jgi:hypothetical protein